MKGQRSIPHRSSLQPPNTVMIAVWAGQVGLNLAAQVLVL
jgi:hypothetical protein